MFRVIKKAQTAKHVLFETETEAEAEKFCVTRHWELEDENGFIWDLDYEKIS